MRFLIKKRTEKNFIMKNSSCFKLQPSYLNHIQRKDHLAVCHHHVDQIQNVKWSLISQLAPAWRTTSDNHQIADLNVCLIANVLVNKHVYNRDAKIHVLDHVASKLPVTS